HQPHTSASAQPLPDTIYHNPPLRPPPTPAQPPSDPHPATRAHCPEINRRNASGPLTAHCIAMHESEWRSVWGLTAFIPSFFDSFSPGS
ncbi:hypothetical protein FG778_23200, partial [Salmonella enterica subsp. enterica serovar Enteritidis]